MYTTPSVILLIECFSRKQFINYRGCKASIKSHEPAAARHPKSFDSRYFDKMAVGRPRIVYIHGVFSAPSKTIFLYIHWYQPMYVLMIVPAV